MMNLGDCAPLQCDTAMAAISGARDPSLGLPQLGELRSQLAHCPPCAAAFDLEVKLRAAMTPSISELPSAEFCSRMTTTLASVDLSQLDITDF